MRNLIELCNWSVGYGDKIIVNNFNLTLTQNDYLHLKGSNGSGKTTLLKSIVGFLRPINGNFYFSEQNVTNFGLENRISLGIGYLRQVNNVFVNMNATTMWRICHKGSLKSFYKRVTLLKNIWPSLNMVQEKAIGAMSGGFRQLVAIGAVLINPRKIILLDEPTNGLSPKFATEFYNGIENIRKKENTAVVLVEHNHFLADTRCNKSAILPSYKG